MTVLHSFLKFNNIHCMYIYNYLVIHCWTIWLFLSFGYCACCCYEHGGIIIWIHIFNFQDRGVVFFWSKMLGLYGNFLKKLMSVLDRVFYISIYIYLYLERHLLWRIGSCVCGGWEALSLLSWSWRSVKARDVVPDLVHSWEPVGLMVHITKSERSLRTRSTDGISPSPWTEKASDPVGWVK